AARAKNVAQSREFSHQRLEIVDLAIINDADRPILVEQRLITGREIDDRQPVRGDRGYRSCVAPGFDRFRPARDSQRCLLCRTSLMARDKELRKRSGFDLRSAEARTASSGSAPSASDPRPARTPREHPSQGHRQALRTNARIRKRVLPQCPPPAAKISEYAANIRSCENAVATRSRFLHPSARRFFGS